MVAECKNCKLNKKIQAVGLCFTCYDKQYSAKHPQRRLQKTIAERKRRAKNPNKTRQKQVEYKSNLQWAQRVLINNGSSNSKDRRSNLTIELLQALQNETTDCKCCGVSLDYKYNGRHIRPPNLATLDKIIPKLGYVPTNIAIICFTCNSRKRDMSIFELQTIIDYIKRNTQAL